MNSKTGGQQSGREELIRVAWGKVQCTGQAVQAMNTEGTHQLRFTHYYMVPSSGGTGGGGATYTDPVQASKAYCQFILHLNRAFVQMLTDETSQWH